MEMWAGERKKKKFCQQQLVDEQQLHFISPISPDLVNLVAKVCDGLLHVLVLCLELGIARLEPDDVKGGIKSCGLL